MPASGTYYRHFIVVICKVLSVNVKVYLIYINRLGSEIVSVAFHNISNKFIFLGCRQSVVSDVENFFLDLNAAFLPRFLILINSPL